MNTSERPRPRKELSAKTVAYRLGCSSMQVRRFVAEGRLHIRRDEPQPGCLKSRIWFDATEVAELQRTWKRKSHLRARRPDALEIARNERGKIAAAVFKCLREGMPLDQIVIETEADPLLVRELEEEYRTTFEERRRQKARRIEEEKERQEQIRHDKRLRLDRWAAHQLQIANAQKRTG